MSLKKPLSFVLAFSLSPISWASQEESKSSFNHEIPDGNIYKYNSISASTNLVTNSSGFVQSFSPQEEKKYSSNDSLYSDNTSVIRSTIEDNNNQKSNSLAESEKMIYIMNIGRDIRRLDAQLKICKLARTYNNDNVFEVSWEKFCHFSESIRKNVNKIKISVANLNNCHKGNLNGCSSILEKFSSNFSHHLDEKERSIFSIGADLHFLKNSMLEAKYAKIKVMDEKELMRRLEEFRPKAKKAGISSSHFIKKIATVRSFNEFIKIAVDGDNLQEELEKAIMDSIDPNIKHNNNRKNKPIATNHVQIKSKPFKKGDVLKKQCNRHSEVRPSLKITKDKWVLSINRLKKSRGPFDVPTKDILSQHAFIILEGIDTKNEYIEYKDDTHKDKGESLPHVTFFIDFVIDESKPYTLGVSGIGKVRIHTYKGKNQLLYRSKTRMMELGDYIREKENVTTAKIKKIMYSDAHHISIEDAKSLLDDVQQEANKDNIKFLLSGKRSILAKVTPSEDGYNCFTWVKEKVNRNANDIEIQDYLVNEFFGITNYLKECCKDNLLKVSSGTVLIVGILFYYYRQDPFFWSW